jgi:hypothetical protein
VQYWNVFFSFSFCLLLQCFNCSNPEFQKSMKEFSEKLGVVKEDLKVRYDKWIKRMHFFHLDSCTDSSTLNYTFVCNKFQIFSWITWTLLSNVLCRTKKTAETVSKSVDDVLAEAEATSKKVSQPWFFIKDDRSKHALFISFFLFHAQNFGLFICRLLRMLKKKYLLLQKR